MNTIDPRVPRGAKPALAHMFATLWSSPIATNAEIGKKIAANFPAASLALTDIQTAMRTQWLVKWGLRSESERVPRSAANKH